MGGTSLIVDRTENPTWLSNAYLVADEPGGKGMLIDGNDELGPLLERAEREGIEITHVLVTHPHLDHVAGLAEASRRIGDPPLVAHAEAAAELDEEVAETIADGGKLRSGGLEVEAISTPGHAAGHLSFLVNGSDVFTADVLFKGTVGGTMAPGASGFADLRASVMRLMELPPETRVHPGHREPTTIGAEREDNPFVRIWRGLDRTGEETCTIWDRPATLKLWAPDYDGGNKAWVVFDDDGTEAIVGGSQVVRSVG
jgi:glyoxylase-like metal-dependent hydrolase (beta-lactamase superfamily II)